MLSIAGALLGGWILSWFGFDNLVISGMMELFGKTITTTGYYFMFAIMGALSSIALKFKSMASLDFNKKNK